MNLAFAEEVRKGLTSNPKSLSSKYFYDQIGDEIFQKIMNMPAYYLTNSEYEILQHHRQEMLEMFGNGGKSFHLFEFGAGDGYKTKILLNHFLNEKAKFKYAPIDISKNALQELSINLKHEFPNLVVETIHNEYFQALDNLDSHMRQRKVILFLGANIGNFTLSGAAKFLAQLSLRLVNGDQVMIGFDLMKNPETILNAYNDAEGITRDFNLNLLRRINTELGGDFQLDNFQHWPVYDPVSGTTKSYLVSKKAQTVTLADLDESFDFNAWEAIDMEISQKYNKTMILELAQASGLEIVAKFFDKNRYFVDVIFQKPAVAK